MVATPPSKKLSRRGVWEAVKVSCLVVCFPLSEGVRGWVGSFQGLCPTEVVDLQLLGIRRWGFFTFQATITSTNRHAGFFAEESRLIITRVLARLETPVPIYRTYPSGKNKALYTKQFHHT